MVRRGVFGGSFDPVHNGHLIVAEAAADRLGLDEVRFVPAARQPFKTSHPQTDSVHRVAMLRGALEGNSRFVPDLREIERGGVSYTVDTLEALRAGFPGDELFLLVGADAARDFAEWRAAERLPTLAALVVLTRPGGAKELPDGFAQRIEVPAIDISATEIRRSVREGRSIRYLVPEVVRDYIADHGLYQEEA